ncbi:MAG: Na/Pi cotransporter family protein, partial [Synergistaceae bacterium]|nr:Na/Pi cotransporter family protein [Synergistaceae bacterium]
SEIWQKGLSGDLSTVLGSYVNGTGDIERIGDHATNLIELFEYKVDNGVEFSPVAWDEFREMFDLVEKAVELSLESLKEENAEKAREVDLIEEEVDRQERMLRKNHIAMLNTGDCTPSAGVIFIDILSNLERICDHAHNVSFIALDIARLHG